MTDNKNQLREDAIEFAIQISDLCDEIKGCSVYVNQIVRSSSSIGANIHEAKYAQSKADFINKLEISLKECSETEYWLELLFDVESISDDVAEVSHINGNDKTCEGICYKNIPAFSVQFRPETCGGPQDTSYLYDRFIKMMEGK